MSGMLVVVGVMMGFMQNNPEFPKIPNQPNMQMVSIGYAIFGVFIGVMALLRLISGIMILRKRGRLFAIVVSVLGLASVFTCYCSLTSVGLCVYSLIVLIQPSVIAEFEKGRTV